MQRKLSDWIVVQELLLFCRQLQKFPSPEGETPHPAHLISKVQDRFLENILLDFRLTGTFWHSETENEQFFFLLLLTEFQ